MAAHVPQLTPVICGPTAGGKSDLAVSLALAVRERLGIDAEIITADAFQIYSGMDIGTAKPSIEEQRGVRHHLLDLIDPHEGAPSASSGGRGEAPSADTAHGRGSTAQARVDSPAPSTDPDGHSPGNIAHRVRTDTPSPSACAEGSLRSGFTVDDWLKLANAKIDELRAANTLPIVVGGTHLYIKALVDGLFEGPEPDAALRAELAAMDPAARRAELERVDPVAAARIHPNDARRTIRALEVFRLTGRPISAHQTQWDPGSAPPSEGSRHRHLLILLNWETEALNRRINARVRQMMDRGLLEELRGLTSKGPLAAQPAEALGYKQLLPLLGSGKPWPPSPRELDEAVERIKIETRRFAKNQRTWLRRLSTTPGCVPLACAVPPGPEAVEAILPRIAPKRVD